MCPFVSNPVRNAATDPDYLSSPERLAHKPARIARHALTFGRKQTQDFKPQYSV